MSIKAFPTAVLAILLAGCVGGSAEEIGPDPKFGDPDGVIVSGLVISEELFPVPGAVVTLDTTESTYTDEAGRFLFPSVMPGSTFNLSVEAIGYEPFAMDLEVVGPVDGLRISLVGIPGKSPYVATYPFTGFDACSFSAVYSAGPFPGPCAFGTRSTIFKVEVGEDWAAGVHELVWESSESMIFASAVATEDLNHGRQRASCISGTSNGQPFNDWCPAMLWGPSPLRIHVRPNDTEYAARYAIDGKEVWPGGENFTSFIFSSYMGYGQAEINNTLFPACVQINRQFSLPENWGCPFGVGYSLGVKVQYYHTTFYLQPPGVRLEEYTALPDQ